MSGAKVSGAFVCGAKLRCQVLLCVVKKRKWARVNGEIKIGLDFVERAFLGLSLVAYSCFWPF